MRVAFAGTPEFAAVALDAILAAGHTVPLVLTQPDRPAGRGMKLQASAVKQVALQHGLPVAQPHSLRLDGKYPDEAAAARDALLAAQPDVMVVAAYGLILPQWTLDLPRLGCLNIHGSLLPRWRGAAPIHRSIEAGDAQTGITIMQMDAGLDTGDMLLIGAEPIRADDTTAVLHDRLAALGGRLIVEALSQAGSLVRTPQPSEGVNYAHKIEKAEAAIDWSQPAAVIERRVRAFDPFPGCTFTLPTEKGPEVVKLWRASVVPASGAPGEVLHGQGDTLVVACGEQALALHTLQRPGGKRVAAREFLQSCTLPASLA
ncbi:methionyl-tRNA formyltransferase [Aquabacterium parvum]|uniref:methionyl-tRNA formyltransferase n=1 Tax=Aquabacterium parvum TaxID=70584 RepID=UPI000718D9EE|nr:methionyl-tRNA formyltransferase [Aquabacterium parvum]MBU0915950.1 methionyl-tRNA formyltransferase [Gammaproteobacteria bacterium]